MNVTSSKTPRLARTELVTIINDYYTFLTTFYIPFSALKHPPPEGWPNVTAETTRDLDKSPYVIDLMKHLAYIDDAKSRGMITNVHYKSDVVDYSTYTVKDFESGRVMFGEEGLRYCIEEMEKERKEGDVEDEEDHGTDANGNDYEDEEIDSGDEDATDDESNVFKEDYDDDNIDIRDILVLSMGYESAGRILLLDVHKGVIHEDMIRYQLLSGVMVERFFDDLKDKLKRLVYVPVRGEFFEDVSEVEDDGPVPETADQSLDWHDKEHVKVVKRIYRKFGWPGESYRKDEAMEAVERYRASIQDD
jgi:hypothetical protein